MQGFLAAFAGLLPRARPAGAPFFGDPVRLIFGRTDPNPARKPKKENTRKGVLFFGATGRTCKERSDGTAIVRRRRDRVTSFRQSGQWPKRCPRMIDSGASMELLAGLEPATC